MSKSNRDWEGAALILFSVCLCILWISFFTTGKLNVKESSKFSEHNFYDDFHIPLAIALRYSFTLKLWLPLSLYSLIQNVMRVDYFFLMALYCFHVISFLNFAFLLSFVCVFKFNIFRTFISHFGRKLNSD